MGFWERLRSERGATAVEYAILTFIAMTIVIAAAFMGGETDGMLGCAGNSLINGTPCP